MIEFNLHGTTVEIIHDSLLNSDVQAIVNANNTRMRGGSGINGAIHNAAGPGLMNELERVAPKGAPTSYPIVTEGHDTDFDYIIHVAGPIYDKGQDGEHKALELAYANVFDAAVQLGVESLGYCSISTGIYRFPLEEAAILALRTICERIDFYRLSSPKRVVFAMFQQEEYDAFKAAAETLGVVWSYSPHSS